MCADLALHLVHAVPRVRRSGEWAEPLLLGKVGDVGVELDCVCTCREWVVNGSGAILVRLGARQACHIARHW